MTAVRTTLFQSNRSQAVRLPKDVAFPEGVKEVRIIREGKSRRIVPVDALWDDFFSGERLVGLQEPEDFEPQARDPF